MFKEQASPRPDTTSPIKKPPVPTGAAFSAHFEDSMAANEEFFDRQEAKKNERKKRETQKINERRAISDKTLSKYTLLALSPEGGLEQAVALWKEENVKKWLFKSGILEESGRGTVLADKKALTQTGWSQWYGNNSHHPSWNFPDVITKQLGLSGKKSATLGVIDFFSYLKDLPATEKEDKTEVAMPVTTFPASFDQIISGEYPACHLKPWEIFSAKRELWHDPITLADGTQTNLVELYMASRLRELDFSPTDNGKFSISDPDTGKRISISADTLSKKYLLSFGDSTTSSLQSQPGDFTQKYLKNLTKANILRPDNFKKVVKSFSSSDIAPSDRHFSNTTDISLQTPGGKSLKYYIGREKIVGTDIPFDRDKIVLRYLDDRTCGLIRIDNNHEEILCTFPLVSSEEVDKMREAVRKRLSASGKRVDEQTLAGRTYLGGKEMAQRLRIYKVSDYLSELPNESSKQYADRVSGLSDARLVSRDTRQFFQKVGIGLHQLPWEEQLGAASILIDPRVQKEAVAHFCEQFGKDGLRAFISSTFGENINKQILALGERSPDIAKTVFAKYGEILTAARNVEDFLLPILQKKPIDAEKQNELLRTVKSQLTKRAKLIIEKISEAILAKKDIGSEAIDLLKKNLSQVQSDIELFASTIKTTAEADADVSLEDFAGARTAILNGQDVSKEDRERMFAMYAQNFKGNPKKQTRLLEEFSAALNSGKTKLYTLHYQGSLLSFIRFDERDDHTLYAGSFNVDPNVRGMKIGEAMMEVALDTEAKEHILTGTCAGWKAICAKYIEGGFVGVETKTTEGGEINIELIRDDKRHHLLKSSTLTPEEIVSMSINNQDSSLRIETVSDPKQYTFPLLKEGYFLTRYLQPSKGGAWYLVFEKRPSSSEAR